jgi:hypothetical protein
MIADEFELYRYVMWPAVVKEPKLSALYQHALGLAAAGAMRTDDFVPNTPSLRAEPLMETLLRDLLPDVETATKLRLYPTYSYFRVYKRGDILRRHRDRPSCEISVSLNLGVSGASCWPLCIEGPCGSAEALLAPGDALLYRGRECVHWRDPFEGDHCVQVFFHYVDQDGPYADHKFDRRSRLNLPAD